MLDEGQKTTGNLNMNSKKLLNLGAHKIVYDTNNPHIVTNVKNQLEYSDGFSRSVAKTVFGIQALMAQQPTPIEVLKLENYCLRLRMMMAQVVARIFLELSHWITIAYLKNLEIKCYLQCSNSSTSWCRKIMNSFIWLKVQMLEE